jgi:hypothetical protein
MKSDSFGIMTTAFELGRSRRQFSDRKATPTILGILKRFMTHT